MAGGYEASGNRFKSIVGSELGDDSLIDPEWYNGWIQTFEGDSNLRGVDLIQGPEQGAEYIVGLSETVKKGKDIIKGGGRLTPAQAAEFSIANAALGDVLSDPTIPSSDNERLQTAVLGARSALDDGEVPELPDAVGAGRNRTVAPPGGKTVRLAHQCFLLYNLEPFSKFHRQLLGGVPAAFAPGTGNPFYNHPTRTGTTANTSPTGPPSDMIKTSGYFSSKQNTTRMYLVSDDSTESSITNKLALKKHGDKIANMQSSEISQLIPRLRFFKVYREEDDKSVVEFEFSPATKISSGLNEKIDIEFLGATQNKFIRGDDVGLKSFDWEFVGSDPFTATREVAASINLTAQHFSSYVKKRTSSNTKIGKPNNKGEYRFLDFVLQPDCRDLDQRNLNYQNFSPECYEIRVEVGYNGGGRNFGTFDSDGQFQEAINCHKDVLLLSPTDHKFEFNDDGSVDLTINLRGRLDALMNDKMMNILLPYGGAGAALMQVNIANIDQDQRDQIPLLKGNKSPEISLEEAENAVKYVNNNKKNIDNSEKLQEDLELAISKMYVSNKQLFFAHIFDKLDTGGAIHSYVMTPEEKNTYTQWATDIAFSALPPTVSLADVYTGGRIGTTAETGNRVAGFGEGGVADTLRAENFVDLFAGLVSPTQEALSKEIEKIQKSEPRVRMTNLVNYFFLGDLLAVVLDSITGEDTFDSGEITTSAISRLDVGLAQLLSGGRDTSTGPAATTLTQALQQAGFKKTTPPPTVKNVLDSFRVILGNIDARLKATGANQTINLAHIPISVPLFNEFMIENVLAKDSDNYPFFEFVNHLISSLIINTLGTKCFGGLIDTSTTTQAMMANSPENIEDTNVFRVIGLAEAAPIMVVNRGPDEEAAIDAREIAGESTYRTIDPALILPDNPILGNCREQQKDVFEYLFIGTQTIDPNSLNGEYDADLRRGIYHTAFGADRGLIKTMKFAKTNQEFLPEAQFASEGGLLLNQLSNAFDVSIEMVGNNLFKIGQYLYIDAEALGAGPSWADMGQAPARQRSYANIMGLGGYHLITEVANSISDSGVYTTTVKARWQDPGTRPDWPDVTVIP